MFILSLYEDLVQGFEVMRPQLVRLWGKERSISLVDNIRILEWLVVKCEPIIKACRKKRQCDFTHSDETSLYVCQKKILLHF